jgi:hypothetical protein
VGNAQSLRHQRGNGGLAHGHRPDQLDYHPWTPGRSSRNGLTRTAISSAT